MPSDAAEDQSAADGFLQRAHLLAELGRYDEGIGELTALIASEPAHVEAWGMLARMQLAAGRPAEALTVAEAALAADPGAVPPLVTRGLALVDLERWKGAASTAEEILALGPDDAYAQRSAAAILSAARNGQPALNAAWRGVELTPDEPEAHLVLGLVSVRLALFDLAERAYREALRLDPALAEAGRDPGVARLERRRYAEALERLTEAADISPARPDPARTADTGLRRLVLSAAGWSLLLTVLVAALAPAAPGASRLLAVLAAVGVGLLAGLPAARLPGARDAMSRGLSTAVYAVAAAPLLLAVYALVGGVWPLVGAITATVVAGFAVFRRG
ncbi:tetratricopeptide repeat protein [Micromonospora sp. WMMD980]|uniref:tetratricopeptide repeat protein n=1 Tax=Micromonospora sp. WMMD980 TaxID=3016088 RepID=UPI0024166674|nr:tetratricopeptide repeat protein [Micromonospora sp. WMMD980]MDG4804332.1 tetratricopeptide repeat protein [Micromonospora sp. WMMD980]